MPLAWFTGAPPATSFSFAPLTEPTPSDDDGEGSDKQRVGAYVQAIVPVIGVSPERVEVTVSF